MTSPSSGGDGAERAAAEPDAAAADPVSPPAADPNASLLADLNPEQRQAALALVGPVAILAGAGTGKTRTITRRIAYGVRTGVYDPHQVLALTFTRKAAGELRGRLRDLGVPDVQARTFHSAASKQLNHFWPQLVGGPPPKVVGGKGALLAQAADRMRLRRRLDPGLVREVSAEIEWRKTSELAIADYARAAGERGRLPAGIGAEELVDLMQAYEDLKDERRVIDFEDILLATVGMLELEPWVTQSVRTQYRFFVVDEYQDVSPLQQRLLDLWLGDRRNLCVVGDPAQTIFSFAGATSRLLTGFQSRYPDARVLELTGSYRSSAQIIEAANEIARRLPRAIELRPVEGTPMREPKPEILEFADEAEEARAVAERIAEDLRGGGAPDGAAVLARLNAQLEAVADALERHGLPWAIASERSWFDEPSVRQALAAIRAQCMVDGTSRPLFQFVSDVVADAGWMRERPSDPGPMQERWYALERLLRFADAQPAGATLAGFSAELAERERLRFEPPHTAVVLSTIHAAKGLEWDSVHLIGCTEGLLPFFRAETEEEVHEERRLFYVAITRARRRLRLSSASSGGPGEGRRAPSRFLAELGTRTRRATGPAAAPGPHPARG